MKDEGVKRMRKGLPISALITGLLAAPALGSVPLLERGPASVQTMLRSFPAAMPREVEEEMRRLSRGGSLNSHGMQGLRRRLAEGMRAQLAQVSSEPRSSEALVPVQIVVPGNPGATVNLLAPSAARKEKAAFLGVATSAPSPTLRAQLNLSRGMGLVVDLVEKESPAEAAGVKVHDILQKFDEQFLVNAQQLAVLVRSKRPGDEIKLTLLREGKQVTVSTKLVEKEVPLLEEMQEPRLQGNAVPQALTPEELLQKLPANNSAGNWMNLTPDGMLTRRLVDEQNDITFSRDANGNESILVKDRQGRVFYNGPADKADLEPEVMKKIGNLRKPAVNAAAAPAPGGTTSRNISATRMDDKYQISVTSDGKATRVVAKDLSGKQIFEGSADSDADFKAMPADVAERVKGMLEKIK